MTSQPSEPATAPAAALRLPRLIADEGLILRSFVELLQQEEQLLTKGNIDELAPLIEEKGRLASLLGQLAEQRNKILATTGYSPDRAGIQTWLAQSSSPAQALQETKSHWEDILSLAAQARSLNETNGQLIGNRLQHNQQTLNALLTASNKATLYGPDGQTHASGNGRSFGAV